MNYPDRYHFLRASCRGLLLGLCAGLLLLPPPAAADDDDDDDDGGVSSRYITYEGRPAIRLDEATRERAAIETRQLRRVSLPREIPAMAEVLDISTLLQQRSEYLDRRAEQQQLAAALKVSAAEVERLTRLQGMDSNISLRELQAARLKHRRERIRLETLEQQQRNARRLLRQQWGPVLSGWATQAQSEGLAALGDGERALLMVRLPSAAVAETVYVGPGDRRESARAAQYLSPASRASANRRGNTHLYILPAGELRSGMHLYAWVPDPRQSIDGILLPREAIVWFNGRPWYYVRRTETVFMKQPVGEHVSMAGGWLLPDLEADELEVVTAGNQLLLSEEYRWQIPDEDDDP